MTAKKTLIIAFVLYLLPRSYFLRCQGMRLSVNGFRDEQFLAQAAAAGVDLASGNVLWPFSLAGADEVTPSAALSA